jgi:hypothetical protein
VAAGLIVVLAFRGIRIDGTRATGTERHPEPQA